MTVPGPSDVAAALDHVPADVARTIAEHAVNMVLQGFLSGQAYAEADRVLSDEDARGEAFDLECRLSSGLYTMVERAFPDLFGPDGEHPAWASTAGHGGGAGREVNNAHS